MDKSLIEKICVDDFAFRKRFSYGTVMVNLETHKIIDILPSREMVDVKAWLDTFPNIKVVSRDGSASYASAIRLSHPEAIQISDRFHLLKGLSEAVNKFIIREFHSRVEIPSISPASPEMLALYETSNRAQRIRFAHKKRKAGLTVAEIALLLHSCPTTIRKYLSIPENEIPEDVKISRERQHQLAIKQKQKEVEEARNLFSQGYSIEKIGIMMNHITATIKKYLTPSYSAINGHYDNRIPGKLTPYEHQVIELRSKGITYQEIHNIISAEGYDGTVSALRMFMQKERAHTKTHKLQTEKELKEFVQRRSLCRLIYKKLENIAGLSQEQYDAVIKRYPVLGSLYESSRDFHRIVFSKKVDEFDEWFSRISTYEIPEIITFLEGMRKDILAVKNSITYPYSNGLAEGSVNKIKLTKRIMFGRNSFELLKTKLLLNEIYS